MSVALGFFQSLVNMIDHNPLPTFAFPTACEGNLQSPSFIALCDLEDNIFKAVKLKIP